MMSPIKIQIEVRYTPVLNFRDTCRLILSPYLKMAQFDIDNADTIDENITLVFKEEGYSLSARWDRLIFVCDGKPENLFTANGPLLYFNTILEKIKGMPSFGEFRNTLIAVWYLNVIEKTEEEILNEFKERHFKSVLPGLEGYRHEDVGIMVNLEDKGDLIRMQFGPFQSETDIQTFHLNPISSSTISALLNKKGVLNQIVVIEKNKIIDLDVFKKIDKKINGLCKQLQNE